MADSLRAAQLRVGRYVQRLRRERGLTQEGLAELTGGNWRHIGLVERGDGNPRLGTLLEIAHALDVEVTDLLTRSPRRKAKPPLFLATRRELEQLEQIVKNIRSAKQTPPDDDRE